MNYDKIASHYDNGYEGYFFTKEDEQVSRMIGKQVGKVLDIGCGTGLGIKILDSEPKHYFGLDVSKKIIEIAKKKNPQYSFYTGKVTDLVFDTKFDIAVALYGVMNYLSNEEIEKTINSAYSFFFMDYCDGYHPICYPNNEYPVRQFDRELFNKYFKGKFNNYNIYTNVNKGN